MFKFGIELEGFCVVNGSVAIPVKGYPTDGFPGLVEVRSRTHYNLVDACFEVLKLMQPLYGLDTQICEHTFTPQQRLDLRRRHNEKTSVSINNIYGKSPKALGNKTLASFQINISMEKTHYYTDNNRSEKYIHHQPFDFVPIVRALDKEFETQIKQSKRQPGWYSIKDECRLEYRSLPNFVFPIEPRSLYWFATNLESVIRKVE